MSLPKKNYCFNDASWTTELTRSVYAASFLGKLYIGKLDYDGNHNLIFDHNNTVVIPTAKFFAFADFIDQVRGYFSSSSAEKIEFILDESKLNRLVLGYNVYKNNPQFQLYYHWNWKLDNAIVKLDADGKQVTPSNQDNDWTPTKNGITLNEEQTCMLADHLNNLLTYTQFCHDDKLEKMKKVDDFISWMSKPEQAEKTQFLIDKYPQANFRERFHYITPDIIQMLNKDQSKKDINSHQIKQYKDILKSKLDLIYSVLRVLNPRHTKMDELVEMMANLKMPSAFDGK